MNPLPDRLDFADFGIDLKSFKTPEDAMEQLGWAHEMTRRIAPFKRAVILGLTAQAHTNRLRYQNLEWYHPTIFPGFG